MPNKKRKKQSRKEKNKAMMINQQKIKNQETLKKDVNVLSTKKFLQKITM